MFEHPKFCVWSGHRVLIRTVCFVLQDRFRKQSGFPSSVAFCYSAQVCHRREIPPKLGVGLCVIFALLNILIVKWFRTLLRIVNLS